MNINDFTVTLFPKSVLVYIFLKLHLLYELGHGVHPSIGHVGPVQPQDVISLPQSYRLGGAGYRQTETEVNILSSIYGTPFTVRRPIWFKEIVVLLHRWS